MDKKEKIFFALLASALVVAFAIIFHRDLFSKESVPSTVSTVQCGMSKPATPSEPREARKPIEGRRSE